MKEKNCISEVVGRYVSLSRKGSKAKGLCPFHEDHHPSLIVDIRKQTFACYACGARGDLIEFIRQIENCSFQEALRKIGGGETFTPAPEKAVQQKTLPKTVREIPDHRIFEQLLLPCASGHSELSPVWLEFGVGQAPHQVPAPWHSLRGRVIFPLHDPEGKLVGFAGRHPEADTKEAKYINTSAADGYQRNQCLYGLYKAKEAIRQSGTVFLTEGYKDVLAMHAAGFNNTVAIGGTELTDGQVRLLLPYTKQVFLLLDQDTAGIKAAEKIEKQLTGFGIPSRILCLQPGQDPDSRFRQMGRAAFRDYILQLTDPAGHDEALLLTACLIYPETWVSFNGNSYRFPELVTSTLETDVLPFSSLCHRELLSHLAGENHSAAFSSPLAEEATRLRDQFEAEVRTYIQQEENISPGETGKEAGTTGQALRTALLRLLVLYSESRLTAQLTQLSRSLNQAEETPVNRLPILLQITERQSLFRHLSTYLHRPGIL